MLGIVLAGLALVMVSGAAGFWLARRRTQVEEPVHRFDCPRCKQRFRYRSLPAKERMMCPRCLVYLRLPSVLRAS